MAQKIVGNGCGFPLNVGAKLRPAIVVYEFQNLKPVDLNTIHYENTPWDTYHIGEKWRK